MSGSSTTDADRPWIQSYPAGLDWHATIPQEPVFKLLDRAVAAFPQNPAIDFMGRGWSYAELGEMVNKIAHGLQMMGIKKGDRIALCLPNSPYYIASYYGIMKAGGVVVNLNPLYAEQEMAHLINDSGAMLAITMDLTATYPKLGKLLGKSSLNKIIVCPMAGILPFPKNVLFPLVRKKDLAVIPQNDSHVGWRQLLRNAGQPENVEINPLEDLAVLQYTGGTTGVPKGAMLTHGNISANAHQARIWFQGAQMGNERMLGVLPFFHVFAMTAVLNLSISYAAEIVCMPRFELQATLKTIQKKKITLFPAVPTIFTAINNAANRDAFDLSSIRFCISGGAPLPVEVKKIFVSKTGCKLVEGYGLSESSPLACCGPLQGVNKDGTIGFPVSQTDVMLVSLEDLKTPVKQGERGELCIRGPQVMKGYWNRPDETAATLAGGWLHTGDVAEMDADGYFTIVDRIKELILCSGFNVYPRNVEEQIYTHPAVAETIVGGVPDEYRGETVKAWVYLKPGQSLSRDELLEHLKPLLSSIEIPKHVEFRKDPLPKTMIGKLSRKTLVDEEKAKIATMTQKKNTDDMSVAADKDQKNNEAAA